MVLVSWSVIQSFNSPTLKYFSTDFKVDLKWFVSLLESCMVETCKHFGVSAFAHSSTGVFVQSNLPTPSNCCIDKEEKKIGAIGLQLSRFRTMHGLSLNCSIDPSVFSLINACGLNTRHTNLSIEANRSITIDLVEPIFLEIFQSQFRIKLQ